MNERIKLPPQDWLGYDPERGDIHGYTFEQMREFAELIVRECVSQIAMIGVSNCENDDVVWTVDKSIENIRKHFGVEE